MRAPKSIRLISSLPLLIALSSIGSSANAQISDAKREALVRQSQERGAQLTADSALVAGNADAPQIVGDAAVPTREGLLARFDALRKSLKPAFIENMTKPAQHAKLEAAGCSIDDVLPIGVEYKPDHLDGTLAIFRCPDGAYGRLEVTQPFKHAKRSRSFAKEALNDNVGSIAAVGRYRQTTGGLGSSILRWQEHDGASVTLDVIVDQALANRQGPAVTRNPSATKAKNLAHSLAGVGQ